MENWKSGTKVISTTGGQPLDETRFAYWRDRDMAVDHDHCFLCGTPLNAPNRTDEHVFPKWMLRRFNLWDEELTLLNRTHIKYRSLTVPCCRDCNTFWLSQVEEKVSSAFVGGHEAVAKLDKTLLCLWMWKLYYGIHFKEIALPADRQRPAGQSIVSAGYLGRFAEVHHVLQAMRNRVRFERVPGSVYVFETQVPEKAENQFDYRDSRLTTFLAIRAADTAVMASFDWGAMEALIDSKRIDAAGRLALHPFQWTELAAYISYVAAQFNRGFAYLVQPEGDHDLVEPVFLMANEQNPDEPIFNPMNTQEWALVLAEALQREVGNVYRPQDEAVWTTLLDADGSLNFMPLEVVPFGSDIRPSWEAPRDAASI